MYALTLSGSFSYCRCCVFCRKIATTMDGSVGNFSRLKPMDARQQPIVASITNVLEAVLQKHSPGWTNSALLRCCSSSPNSTPPSIPEVIVSTMRYRCFSPRARTPPPHTACPWTPCTIHCGRQWPSIDVSHTLLRPTMTIDRHAAHSIVGGNGHRWTRLAYNVADNIYR